MYRVRKRRKSWRERWPWKHWFPPRINQRFCRECGNRYQQGPFPSEVARFPSGQVEVLVYPAGSWRRSELTVRCVRWRAVRGQWHDTEYFTAEELLDLLEGITQAHEYIVAQKSTARR